jgi:hypothetical protein
LFPAPLLLESIIFVPCSFSVRIGDELSVLFSSLVDENNASLKENKD